MSQRLYVGNLSWTATEQDIRQHFSSIGPVTDAKIILDRETGKSRGFAFVTMASEADAARVQVELNGRDFMGRRLNINEASERQSPGGPRPGGAPRSFAPRAPGPGPVIERVSRGAPPVDFGPPPDFEHGGRRERDRKNRGGNGRRGSRGRGFDGFDDHD